MIASMISRPAVLFMFQRGEKIEGAGQTFNELCVDLIRSGQVPSSSLVDLPADRSIRPPDRLSCSYKTNGGRLQRSLRSKLCDIRADIQTTESREEAITA